MNNIELSEKVFGYLKGSKSKAKKFADLVAVTVSLLAENSEDMYITVRDGEILVAPYAYDDNNCAIEATAETIDNLFSGKMSFDKAINDGYVNVKSGDVAKFKALEVLVPAKKAEKADGKSTKAAKSSAKATAKPSAKAAAKPAETKAASKATATKPAAAKSASNKKK